MRKHEIREIHLIGSTGSGADIRLWWRIKFRRYGIVDAIDYIEVRADDELDAFNTATKRLETVR